MVYRYCVIVDCRGQNTPLNARMSGAHVGARVRRDQVHDVQVDCSGMSPFGGLPTAFQLHYAGDQVIGAQAIVSSIEFDRDEEYIAIAGVTKKIKLFNYNEVVSNVRVYLQYPSFTLTFRQSTLARRTSPSSRRRRRRWSARTRSRACRGTTTVDRCWRAATTRASCSCGTPSRRGPFINMR